MRNVGADAAWMVGVLDGSEDGIRYPQYRPLILRDGEVICRPRVPEDPLVTPLRVTDFVRLAPGEGFDPTARYGGAAYHQLTTFRYFVPSVPGTYQYRLTVVTEGGSAEEWLSPVGQEEDRRAVLELVRAVPRVTINAPPLDVVFV